MKKFSAVLIAAVSMLLAFIAVSGCTGTCYYMYYEEDNQASKDVKEGCTIIIQLPENPTTGYSWEMDTGGLKEISSEFVADSGAEGLVGAGGIHKWEFSADKKGTYTIKGIYKRSWEETTPEDKTWTVTVSVV